MGRCAFGLGLALVLAASVSGCGGNGGGAVVATPGQTTGAGVPAQPTSKPSGGAAATGSGDSFVMPDVQGMDLQKAQDRLQSLGSFKLEQVDATRRARKLVRDTEWRVCRQIPEAGQDTPTDVLVRLYAVKDGETCP